MDHLIKEFEEAIESFIVVVFCIGILVSGAFIGTSGLSATGARELAGAAAEINEDDLIENREGVELDGIIKTPDNFSIKCVSCLVANEAVKTDSLVMATVDNEVPLPVSIVSITDMSGKDAVEQGSAQLSGQEVVLHTPGMYRFCIYVIPLQETRNFDIFCEEKE